MIAGIFIDTWAWIAIFTRRDPGHEVAAGAYAILRADRAELVTTSAVIYETLEPVRRRTGTDNALEV